MKHLNIIVTVNCTFRQVDAVTVDTTRNWKTVIFVLSRTFHIRGLG